MRKGDEIMVVVVVGVVVRDLVGAGCLYVCLRVCVS